MELISKYPLLLPLSESNKSFDGFITIEGQDYRFRLIMTNDTIQDSEIYLDWKLQYIWEQNKSLIMQRLVQSSDIKAFLSELHFILERVLKDAVRPVSFKFSPEHYRQILDDIEQLGWEKLVYINDDFRNIHLKAEDEASREHVLQIEITEGLQQTNEQPIIRADLPCSFQLNKNQDYTLISIYNQFLCQLSIFQNFWKQMDEIDEKTWVLEPEKPSRADTKRRIAISYFASLQIVVDPLHVDALPECCFLGSDEAVDELKKTFNSNLEKWSADNSLLTNLRLLGLEFASPEEIKNEDMNMDCGICYAYHFNDSIPDKICDDSRCRQPFHCICLYEWLKALTTSRRSFNMIFGECPYCSKPISCKMPGSK